MQNLNMAYALNTFTHCIKEDLSFSISTIYYNAQIFLFHNLSVAVFHGIFISAKSPGTWKWLGFRW